MDPLIGQCIFTLDNTGRAIVNVCDNEGSQVTSGTQVSISQETLGIYAHVLLRLQAAKSADT